MISIIQKIIKALKSIKKLGALNKITKAILIISMIFLFLLAITITFHIYNTISLLLSTIICFCLAIWWYKIWYTEWNQQQKESKQAQEKFKKAQVTEE